MSAIYNRISEKCTRPHCLLNFNSADEGLVGDGGKDEVDLAAGVGGGGELPDHRFVHRAGRRENVEVSEHLRAIDRDVEDTLTGCCPKLFRKMQPHGMARSGAKAWKRVGKLADAARWAHHPRRLITHTRPPHSPPAHLNPPALT